MTGISTLAGVVEPGALGFTLMHEHLFMLSVGLHHHWPHLIDRDDAVVELIAKVDRAKAAGVRTIVDMTTPNMGRDLAMLNRVAEATGVNIIAATGAHPHEPLPLYLLGVVGDRSDGIDPDRLADLFVHDIEVGMDGTAIKAGIIKTGTDPAVDESNMRLLRAAARAQVRTGVPITTHTHASNKVGLEQQEIFAAEGVDLSHVVIGHCGDSRDLDYLSTLADRGSYLGMDRFGYQYPGREAVPTTERIKVIAELCRRGYAERMVLSSDSVSWSDVISQDFLARHMPDWNLWFLAETVIDQLVEHGVDERDIELMTVVNPSKILSPVTALTR
jgi:phosphotriesterase-related protein